MSDVVRRAWRLLGAMSFAVAVLGIVAAAASIGSFVEQNQPAAAYVGDFGELWARCFIVLGLDDVYHAPWFLALLAFLCLSTGLCVWRNTPGMLREWASYKEHYAAEQLKRLPAWVEIPVPSLASTVLSEALRRAGYRCRSRRTGLCEISAKKGQSRRLGYVLTHLAIVVISIGGLLDGNPAQTVRRIAGELVPASMDTPPSRAAAAARVGRGGGAFRGALRLAPGDSSHIASVNIGTGYVLRELPAEVSLKRFHIDYHAGGQPRDFISDIAVSDPTHPGVIRSLRVSMNHPAQFAGLSFYQSGFDDGGSPFTLRLWSGNAAESVTGQVGQTASLLIAGQPYTLDAQRFYPRSLVAAGESGGSLRRSFLEGARAAAREDLGPRLELQMRDPSGQALDQTIYLQAQQFEGRSYRVVALAQAGRDGRDYLRIPLDAQGRTDDFSALMTLLLTPESRLRLLARLTAGARDRIAASKLQVWLVKALARFETQGFAALAKGVQEQQAAAELLSRLALMGWQELHPGTSDAEARSSGLHFVVDSLQAYNQWALQGRPPLALEGEVQPRLATVLQVSYAPGAALVYAGMAMLAIGVVLMVLVQERRVFVRASRPGHLIVAISANRRLPGLAKELDSLIHFYAAGSAASKGNQ
ncbi:MAG: cytochrome c biogenesis protein ResB [Burkholderiaceae bacterium]|nr:cytochrome c biogenesis protein ResB [Roseateles sp.]MBV8468376.1 cytochrome c biogenesis protein ResB [Burkholderiaceae bacterium]